MSTTTTTTTATSTSSPLVKPALAIHLPTYSPGGRALLRRCKLQRSSSTSPTLHIPLTKQQFSVSAPNTPVNYAPELDRERLDVPIMNPTLATSFSDSKRSKLKYARHCHFNAIDTVFNMGLNNNSLFKDMSSINKNLVDEFNEVTNVCDDDLPKRKKSLPGELVFPKIVDVNETNMNSCPNRLSSELPPISVFSANSMRVYICLLSIFSMLWTLKAYSDPKKLSSLHYMPLLFICIIAIPILFHLILTWPRTYSPMTDLNRKTITVNKSLTY